MVSNKMVSNKTLIKKIILKNQLNQLNIVIQNNFVHCKMFWKMLFFLQKFISRKFFTLSKVFYTNQNS